jgi:hypothetical protein
MQEYSSVLQRFIAECPVSVMARATMQRLFDAAVLNQLFDDHAEAQYTRELAFAHIVELMSDVVFGVAPSVHASYQQRAEELGVSSAALYQKLTGIEPGVCQALLRSSYQQASAVHACCESSAATEGSLPGYRIKIVDGNHLSASEHRLKELRSVSAAPLPGKAVVVLDAETMSISDLYLDEDGHGQERSQIPALIESVTAGELWIADRMYSTLGMINGVAEHGACFLIRQHGSLKPEALSEPVLVAQNKSATVYEQQVRLRQSQESEQPLHLRRISIELASPTRDGETEIHLLSNLPTEHADAERLSELYKSRWRIEEAFFEVTTTLCCEIRTLAYPKAALLAFTLALVSYNIVSVLKSAMRAVHGVETVEQEVSAYYLTLEVRQTYRGMAIAVEAEAWEVFATMSAQTFAKCLQEIASHMRLARYRKHKRGPKKPKPKKKPYINGEHLSTAAIIAKRNSP